MDPMGIGGSAEASPTLASEVSRRPPVAATVLALSGVAVALYVVLAAWLELPGAWTLRRVVDPEPGRRRREVARHASERLASFAAENARVPGGAVVFLGSSTIERMPLATLFPGRACSNRGIASADAAELRAWLPRMLPSAPPAAFVVYAGSIDWREEACPPATVAARVAALISELRRTAPAARIVLLGLLPERDMSARSKEGLAAIDRELAGLARGDVSFLPTARPPLSRPDGSLSEQHSSDRYHLDEAGYTVLAGWIRAEGGDVGRLLSP